MTSFPLFDDFDDVLAPARAEARRPHYPKRAVDLLLAVLLLPFIAPLIAVLWVIARQDGGPGFFGHVRLGRGGVPFRCWKVRTMVPDAEARLAAWLRDNPDAAREWEAGYKLNRDPRITRAGQFLRRTSLDELPQIWNVLRGEMSFVGPRPIVPDELPRYGEHANTYMDLRPGITGLWQVSGRNDLDYHERVALDAEYRRRVSFGRDLVILARTGLAVLRRTGR